MNTGKLNGPTVSILHAVILVCCSVPSGCCRKYFNAMHLFRDHICAHVIRSYPSTAIVQQSASESPFHRILNRYNVTGEGIKVLVWIWG